MNHFTTDIIQALVKKEDIKEVFRIHLEKSVNTLLSTELTAFLDYEKYDRMGFNSGNSRNIAHKVRVADRVEICEDFKSVYRADNRQLGEKALTEFIQKWQSSYPKVTNSLLQNRYLFTFYSFPNSIRRSIYSTNLIVSFNKEIKKYSKRKEQFPNCIWQVINVPNGS